jgi:hypothetical protein
MNHEEYVKSIKFIRPNSEFVLNGFDLQWLDNENSKPTESEIEAGWIAYQEKIQLDIIEAESKKAEAQAKLAALGLTSEDLKALGLI